MTGEHKFELNQKMKMLLIKYDIEVPDKHKGKFNATVCCSAAVQPRSSEANAAQAKPVKAQAAPVATEIESKATEVQDQADESQSEQNLKEVKPTEAEVLPTSAPQQTEAVLKQRPSGCPSDFEYSEESQICFKIHPELNSWNDAHDVCKKVNNDSKLVVFANIQQYNAVKSAVFSFPNATESCLEHGSAQFYTSGQREKDGDCSTQFVWKPGHQQVTVEPGLHGLIKEATNCHRHEVPVNTLPESCLVVSLRRQGGLNDVPCSFRACPVCQVI